MFQDETLPTLDTALWAQDNQVKFRFFEKPTASNQVVHKDTTLPKSSIKSTLIQETVRRLKNCSRDLDHGQRSIILSNFTKKMLNSGFNQDEARKVLVSGVTKYIFLLECSEKPDSDANYKPLYVSKEYNESARQISKYLAKMGWYKSKNAGKEKNENESGI